LPDHPLLIAVGGIVKRPGIIHDAIAIREYVGLTVMFDHDVTDGAPVARFIRQLQELMTDRYGLEDWGQADRLILMSSSNFRFILG
jgi:pyruvate/2-oxoglutarate dehydrogenase complex dihydrolipoamide acyltransferase (E2) component